MDDVKQCRWSCSIQFLQYDLRDVTTFTHILIILNLTRFGCVNAVRAKNKSKLAIRRPNKQSMYQYLLKPSAIQSKPYIGKSLIPYGLQISYLCVSIRSRIGKQFFMQSIIDMAKYRAVIFQQKRTSNDNLLSHIDLMTRLAWRFPCSQGHTYFIDRILILDFGRLSVLITICWTNYWIDIEGPDYKFAV